MLSDGVLAMAMSSSKGPSAPTPESWKEAPAGALIDHILERFHETHRREGPELARAAARLEAAHDPDPDWPRGLAALVDRITKDLVTHMAKEELVVFPRMRRGGGAPLDRPLAVLHAEHDDHTEALRTLGRMTQGFEPPVSADADWRTLYADLARFASDLAEHVRFEDDVLFPRFEPAAPMASAASVSGG